MKKLNMILAASAVFGLMNLAACGDDGDSSSGIAPSNGEVCSYSESGNSFEVILMGTKTAWSLDGTKMTTVIEYDEKTAALVGNHCDDMNKEESNTVCENGKITTTEEDITEEQFALIKDQQKSICDQANGALNGEGGFDEGDFEDIDLPEPGSDEDYTSPDYCKDKEGKEITVSGVTMVCKNGVLEATHMDLGI